VPFKACGQQCGQRRLTVSTAAQRLEPFIFKWKQFDGMEFSRQQENTVVMMQRIVRGFQDERL